MPLRFLPARPLGSPSERTRRPAEPPTSHNHYRAVSRQAACLRLKPLLHIDHVDRHADGTAAVCPALFAGEPVLGALSDHRGTNLSRTGHWGSRRFSCISSNTNGTSGYFLNSETASTSSAKHIYYKNIWMSRNRNRHLFLLLPVKLCKLYGDLRSKCCVVIDQLDI